MRIPERRRRSSVSASSVTRPSAGFAQRRGQLREAILGAQLLFLELAALYLLVGGERQVSLELGQSLFDLVVSGLQPRRLRPLAVARSHADLLHASEPPCR